MAEVRVVTLGPRIMVLDGEYLHTLAVQAELKRTLGATILSVASSTRAPAHRSRYTDQRLLAPHPSDPGYSTRLVELVREHLPDLVVPVGYASFAATLAATDRLPATVRALVPDAIGFDLATNKPRTYELAERIGIRVPRELAVGDGGTQPDGSAVRFPIFAKSRRERGGESTALLRTPDELRAFDPQRLGGDVIFQEYVDGTATYAHNGYFENGRPVISFQHVEVRSVPRRGGSGTRVRAIADPALAALGDRLMAELEWNGVAQVEFKRSSEHGFVLMEINPKLWASYPLALPARRPVIATAAGRALGTPIRSLGVPRDATIVFPAREFMHVKAHRATESVLGSAVAMLWPPAHSNIDIRDLGAHVPRRMTDRTTR